MQPKPMAETFSPLFPSLRFCIFHLLSFQIMMLAQLLFWVSP
jgi:hypothetical protein